MFTVPNVMMVVTVSVVRFSDKTRILVEVMSLASIRNSSFSSSTVTVKSSSLIAAAIPFKIAAVPGSVGV